MAGGLNSNRRLLNIAISSYRHLPSTKIGERGCNVKVRQYPRLYTTPLLDLLISSTIRVHMFCTTTVSSLIKVKRAFHMYSHQLTTSSSNQTLAKVPNVKPTFSGHESFACRQYWLKKGIDYLTLTADRRLSAEDAVVHLGVGKNMVTSINYWLKAFGLVDESNRVSKLANLLFADDGYDPYLEDVGSLWLLHYSLVTTGRATIYNLVFNEFRKERIEFTRQHLHDYLRRKCSEWQIEVSANTIQRDVETLVRLYLRPVSKAKSIEDDFTSLLIDLNLLVELDQARSEGGPIFKIESGDRSSLPVEILLFALLSGNKGPSIPFNHLLNAPNNPGAVYAITADGLYVKLQELVERFSVITFTDDAGVRELQFRQPLDRWQILNDYYSRAT